MLVKNNYNSTSQTLSHNSSFESGALATKGGHVVVYQKADGSIAKSITPVNATALYYNSADHTNEEVARVFHYREFGASRADDFSTLVNSAKTVTFTLDDGTVNMAGTANTLGDFGGGTSAGGAFSNGTNDYITFTFVGSGLDLKYVSQGTIPSTYSIIIDNTTVQTGITGLIQNGTLKIASGLPYGSHTVKILCTNLTGNALQVSQWVVYQPKKPTIPAGAVQIADYNLMADYIPSTAPGADSDTVVATGVLRKFSSRELSYSGTWAVNTTVSNAFTGGISIDSSTNGSFFEYTFWGTGLEVMARGSAAVTSSTIQIDGVAYTGAATATGAGSSWTPGTSTWVASTTEGTRLRISGLTLGIHKIRVTKTDAQQLRVMGLDIITPIHSYKLNLYGNFQSILSIGSQGVSDSRRVAPAAGQNKSTVAVAYGYNSQTAPANSILLPMFDMALSYYSGGEWVVLNHAAGLGGSSGTARSACAFFINGVQEGAVFAGGVENISGVGSQSATWTTYLPKGWHMINVYWHPNGNGGLSAPSGQRSLTVSRIS